MRKVAACSAYYAAGGNPPAETLIPVREALPTQRLDIGASVSCVVFSQKWWNAAGIEVKAGERYQVKATGEWLDASIKTDARGYASTFALKFFEHSRRAGESPWFALIAAIHTDVALELKNSTDGNFVIGEIASVKTGVTNIDTDSQLVATGLQSEIAVARDGFLYFFANDSAFAYSNNNGFLDVTITRSA